MAKGFVESLKRHAKEAAQLEEDKAREFLRLLKATQDELRGRLVVLSPSDQAMDAFRVREILAQAEAAIASLDDRLGNAYVAGARDAGELAAEHLGSELERLSRAFDTRPLNVAIDAQRVLADPVQGLLANHFESSVEKYGIDLLNGVRQRLFIGLRTGEPFGQIVQKVAADQGPFGAVGRVNGERLIRTETASAYGQAKLSGIKQAADQNPGLRKVWLKATSYDCSICNPLHGTEKPLDGTWTVKVGKKTRQVAGPPLHPNCGCSVSAIRPAWRRGLERAGYLEQPAAAA